MCDRSRVARSRSRRDRVMEQMSDKSLIGVNADGPRVRWSGCSERYTAKNKFPFREVKTFQNEKDRTEGLKPLETRCLNRFSK